MKLLGTEKGSREEREATCSTETECVASNDAESFEDDAIEAKVATEVIINGKTMMADEAVAVVEDEDGEEIIRLLAEEECDEGIGAAL